VFIRVQDYQASKEGDERPGNKGRQYRTMKRSRDVAPIAIRHEKISSTKRVISGVERNSLQIFYAFSDQGNDSSLHTVICVTIESHAASLLTMLCKTSFDTTIQDDTPLLDTSVN
jgi:hypothetical protein